MNYITYHSDNAPEQERWCAYLTAFKVFAFGPTEEAAKASAEAFYNSNRFSLPKTTWSSLEEAPKSNRGHANTGKVWMFKQGMGFRRVGAADMQWHESDGWIRKGPRSK